MHKINHFGRVSRVKEEHDDIDRASSEIVSGISHGILGASRTRPRAKARAWRNLDQLPTHSLTQALHLRGYDPKGPDGIFEEDPSAISYSYTAKINIDNISKAIKETVMSSPTELVNIKIFESVRTLKAFDVGLMRNIMLSLDHPNMCLPYELLVIENKTIVSSEYTDGLLLHKFMKRSRRIESDARNIFRQMTSCMAYCHDRDLIHFNLTPASIKVTNNPVTFAKVMDFGIPPLQNEAAFTRIFSEDKMFSYVPPEVLRWRSPYFRRIAKSMSAASNVYTMGVILYEMLTGQVPYAGTKNEVLSSIKKRHLDFHAFISKDLVSLLRAMLDPYPHRRPSAHDCLHHSWTQHGSKYCYIHLKPMYSVYEEIPIEKAFDLEARTAASPQIKSPQKHVTYADIVEVEYIPPISQEEKTFHKKMSAKIKANKKHKRRKRTAVRVVKARNCPRRQDTVYEPTKDENVSCENRDQSQEDFFHLAEKLLESDTNYKYLEHLHIHFHQEGKVGRTETKNNQPENLKPEKCHPRPGSSQECGTTQNIIPQEQVLLKTHELLPQKKTSGANKGKSSVSQSKDVVDSPCKLIHSNMSMIEEALIHCSDDGCDRDEEIRVDKYVTEYQRKLREKLHLDQYLKEEKLGVKDFPHTEDDGNMVFDKKINNEIEKDSDMAEKTLKNRKGLYNDVEVEKISEETMKDTITYMGGQRRSSHIKKEFANQEKSIKYARINQNQSMMRDQEDIENDIDKFIMSFIEHISEKSTLLKLVKRYASKYVKFFSSAKDNNVINGKTKNLDRELAMLNELSGASSRMKKTVNRKREPHNFSSDENDTDDITRLIVGNSKDQVKDFKASSIPKEKIGENMKETGTQTDFESLQDKTENYLGMESDEINREEQSRKVVNTMTISEGTGKNCLVTSDDFDSESLYGYGSTPSTFKTWPPKIILELEKMEDIFPGGLTYEGHLLKERHSNPLTVQQPIKYQEDKSVSKPNASTEIKAAFLSRPGQLMNYDYNESPDSPRTMMIQAGIDVAKNEGIAQDQVTWETAAVLADTEDETHRASSNSEFDNVACDLKKDTENDALNKRDDKSLDEERQVSPITMVGNAEPLCDTDVDDQQFSSGEIGIENKYEQCRTSHQTQLERDDDLDDKHMSFLETVGSIGRNVEEDNLGSTGWEAFRPSPERSHEMAHEYYEDIDENCFPRRDYQKIAKDDCSMTDRIVPSSRFPKHFATKAREERKFRRIIETASSPVEETTDDSTEISARTHGPKTTHETRSDEINSSGVSQEKKVEDLDSRDILGQTISTKTSLGGKVTEEREGIPESSNSCEAYKAQEEISRTDFALRSCQDNKASLDDIQGPDNMRTGELEYQGASMSNSGTELHPGNNCAKMLEEKAENGRKMEEYTCSKKDVVDLMSEMDKFLKWHRKTQLKVIVGRESDQCLTLNSQRAQSKDAFGVSPSQATDHNEPDIYEEGAILIGEESKIDRNFSAGCSRGTILITDEDPLTDQSSKSETSVSVSSDVKVHILQEEGLKLIGEGSIQKQAGKVGYRSGRSVEPSVNYYTEVTSPSTSNYVPIDDRNIEIVFGNGSNNPRVAKTGRHTGCTSIKLEEQLAQNSKYHGKYPTKSEANGSLIFSKEGGIALGEERINRAGRRNRASGIRWKNPLVKRKVLNLCPLQSVGNNKPILDTKGKTEGSFDDNCEDLGIASHTSTESSNQTVSKEKETFRRS